MSDLELNWKGKKTEVEKIVLPFQKIETVSISRTGKETLLAHMGQQDEEWKNKLIWGDNKYVLASLLKDPSIAGKIKLIYIDPPFFTGTNMNINIKIGDKNEVTKEPSAIEEVAYRNMWKEGPSSFLQYMYERLKLMRELLADDGVIYVRFDYHYSHYIKLILDEIFGYENFQNEIIVNRIKKSDTGAMKFNVATDSLFFYTKSQNFIFNGFRKKLEAIKEERWHSMDSQGQGPPRKIFGKIMYPPVGRHWTFSQETIDEMIKQGKIRLNPKSKKPEYKLEAVDTQLIDTNWTDIPGYSFKTGYPTENSEQLLERVIQASSQPGDLVADFFAGSGTTGIVAEKLGRRWLMCDIGRFSIHTIRKRLLDIPTCKPFEVLNMGKYERKYWASENLENYKNYVVFIVKLYNAQILDNFEYIHGKKGSTAIHVGLVDSPVTKKEIFDAIAECKKLGFTSLHVLGWEWEMGLNDSILKEAKDMFGVNLSLRVIPREVMDKRAVDAGDIDFYELAHLDVAVNQDKKSVNIELKDFIIPNPELIPVEIQEKIKKFSDYIDYWAVDWDYKDVFHNEWQTYRSKDSPALKLKTTNHQYTKAGRYQILIKVIDIFGNDTSTIREVVIK
jgi:adenine specific DNA methylase Mod